MSLKPSFFSSLSSLNIPSYSISRMIAKNGLLDLSKYRILEIWGESVLSSRSYILSFGKSLENINNIMSYSDRLRFNILFPLFITFDRNFFYTFVNCLFIISMDRELAEVRKNKYGYSSCTYDDLDDLPF